jgi:hypothetical protein
VENGSSRLKILFCGSACDVLDSTARKLVRQFSCVRHIESMLMCFIFLPVVQEAVSTGDPELLQLVLERRDFQRYSSRVGGIPELLQKLKEVHCINVINALCGNNYIMKVNHTINIPQE